MVSYEKGASMNYYILFLVIANILGERSTRYNLHDGFFIWITVGIKIPDPQATSKILSLS